MNDSTGDVNKQALAFFEDMARRSYLGTAFRLRMERMVANGELPDAMDDWFDEVAGYPGVKVADLEPALKHFRTHRLSFWSGNYALTSEDKTLRSVTIDRDELRVDGAVIATYTYDGDRLSWTDQPGRAAAGTLTFAAGGDAYDNDFQKGTFWKKASGSITTRAEDGATRTTTVSGASMVLWFGEGATASDAVRAAPRRMLGADPVDPYFDTWSGAYTVTPFPFGTTTFQRLDVDAKGTVAYGGIPIEGAAFAKDVPNTLTWNDTTTTKTRGRMTFLDVGDGTTKAFYGYIYASGTAETANNAHGETERKPEDKPAYSVVDIFVITGTVIAGFMMIPVGISSALREDGTLHSFIEWVNEKRKSAAAPRPDDPAPFDPNKLSDLGDKVNDGLNLDADVSKKVSDTDPSHPTTLDEFDATGQMFEAELKAANEYRIDLTAEIDFHDGRAQAHELAIKENTRRINEIVEGKDPPTDALKQELARLEGDNADRQRDKAKDEARREEAKADRQTLDDLMHDRIEAHKQAERVRREKK